MLFKFSRSNVAFIFLLAGLLILNGYLLRSRLFGVREDLHFSLQAKDRSVTEKSLKGHWTLFYFGYTFCPDVCPTSLSNWSATLDMLEEKQRENLQFFFISVDPDRDDLEKLVTYTKHFHPKIEALWAPSTNIKSIADQFGVVYKYYKDPKKSYYTVDHSAFTILVDPKGKIVHRFEHGLYPFEVAESLKKIMSGDSSVPDKTKQ